MIKVCQKCGEEDGKNTGEVGDWLVGQCGRCMAHLLVTDGSVYGLFAQRALPEDPVPKFVKIRDDRGDLQIIEKDGAAILITEGYSIDSLYELNRLVGIVEHLLLVDE